MLTKGARKMDHQVKMFPNKPGNLSLSPKICKGGNFPYTVNINTLPGKGFAISLSLTWGRLPIPMGVRH